MSAKQPEALRLAARLDPVHSCQTQLLDLHREAAAELRRLHALNQELLEALRGFVAIAADSEGVAGYHLNGDIAEWETFPEWHEAHAAIAKSEGGAA